MIYMTIYCSIASNSERLEAAQIFHQPETDFSLSLLSQLWNGKKKKKWVPVPKPWAELALGLYSIPPCPALPLDPSSPSKPGEPSQVGGGLRPAWGHQHHESDGQKREQSKRTLPPMNDCIRTFLWWGSWGEQRRWCVCDLSLDVGWISH